MKSDLAADIMKEIENYNEALALEIPVATLTTPVPAVAPVSSFTVG